MPQVSKYPIRKEVADRIFELFTQVLVNATSKNEAENFITDFFTPTEKIMLAKRIGIMFLLEKNYNYELIKNILRVSTSTIADVNTTRKYRNRGYAQLVDKILKDEEISKFFDDTISKLLSATASGRGKGTGLWRFLGSEVMKTKKTKPF